MATTSQVIDARKKGETRAEIQALLALARSEGGALGEVAEELSNPKRSMLSTIGEGFKSAFSGFVDIIQTPSNIVAGLLSQDLTVQEAMKKNTSVSSVLFGKSPEGFQLQDVGRFAVDVLTDPLTYVTFGAGRGIFGITAAKKFIAGKNAAAKLGIEEGKDIALNEIGEEYLDKIIARQRAGMRHDYLVNERIKIADDILKAGGKVDETDMISRLNKIDKEANDALIEQVLNRRLSHTDAMATLSKMVEYRPQLLETIVDKGGIKVFGKSILSGQRIAATKNLIPGMTLMDHMWEPVRKTVYPLFSTNWTAAGKATSITSTVVQDALNKKASKWAEVMTRAQSIYKKAGVSEQEADLINSAITARKEPADPRAAAIFREVVYGGETSSLSGAGKAARYSKGQEVRNRRMMLEAGVQVNEIENHTTHILTNGNARRGVRSTMSTETDAAKMRSINGFITQEGKELIGRAEKTKVPGRVKGEEVDGLRFTTHDGKESITLRSPSKAVEEDNIAREIALAEKNIGAEVGQISKEVKQLKEAVQGVFDEKIAAKLTEKLRKAGADDLTIKAFKEAAKKYLDEIDVDQLVRVRLKTAYASGVLKKAAVDDMSDEAFAKLLAMVDMGNKKLPDDIKKLNKDLVHALKSGKKKKEAGKGSNPSDGELKEIATQLKKETVEMRREVIEKAMKKNDIPAFLKTMQTAFKKNPAGARRLMDSIIGREQKIADLTEEMETIRKAGDLEKEGFVDLAKRDKMYIDENGKVYKKFTVSAKEARDTLGVDFEENQLLLTTIGSMEAIRVSVANDFMRDLTKLSGKPASLAPAHWRAIDVGKYQKEFGDLSQFLKSTDAEDLLFHPADAQLVENFLGSFGSDEAVENVWKNFDRLTNVFKASVTSIWPAFHGRNAISNVFLHFLDIGVHSLNPANHVAVGGYIMMEKKFGRLMEKADRGDELAKRDLLELESKVLFQDKYNYNWTFGEFRRQVKENVVAFNPNITGLVDWSRTPREMAEQISRDLRQETTKGKIKKGLRESNPLSQDFLPYRGGRAVGSLVEDHARLMDFVVNLKKTGDVGLSTLRTKQFLFDYQNLTRFEKEFMRRVIPFYTFMRKNTELQVRTLFTTPGRIATEIHAIETIGDVLADETLTDEEKAKLPEWMRDRQLITLSKKGNLLQLITGLETPIESFFQITKPNEMLAAANPLIRLPVEMASGVSFFHAKQLTDLTNARAFDDAPGVVKDFIGYHEVTGERNGRKFTYGVSLRPERMHLIMNLPPTSRVFSFLGSLHEKDIDTSAKIGEFFFGMKVNAIDLEVESERREKELKRSLEGLLSDAKVGYTFQRYVPPED